MKQQPEKKAFWEKMQAANTMAVVTIIFTFILVILIMFFPIPDANKDIFISVISFVMGTLVSGVVFYLFGYDTNKKKLQNVDNSETIYQNCVNCGRSTTQLPGEDTNQEEEEEPVN